jgi:hypothetical protein
MQGEARDRPLSIIGMILFFPCDLPINLYGTLKWTVKRAICTPRPRSLRRMSYAVHGLER